MTPLNEAVAEWRRKHEQKLIDYAIETKQYGKTAKEFDRLLTRIRELEAEVQEANDNAAWWHNRYIALGKQLKEIKERKNDGKR